MIAPPGSPHRVRRSQRSFRACLVERLAFLRAHPPLAPWPLVPPLRPAVSQAARQPRPRPSLLGCFCSSGAADCQVPRQRSLVPAENRPALARPTPKARDFLLAPPLAPEPQRSRRTALPAQAAE